jgi:hypothetical protein
MKKEAMSEGQSLGLEEQLRSLSPIISAAMENKAVINLTIYAGNIGQKIDHATHVFMEADEEFKNIFRRGTEKDQKKTTDDKREPMDPVAKCFKFPNDFVKQKVKAVVNDYHQGIAANLALIEVTLFDHNLLNKRNAHTALLKALMAWDMIDQLSDEELKKTTNGMANKLGFLPSAGYMEWNDKSYVNDKKTCMDIGKDLGSTMPYSRKKEE